MWIYKNKEFAPDESLLDPKVYYGFVYEITDLQNQKKYIGKKFFWATKTLPVTKSRKRKKRLLVESNWKDYYGSSETLSEEVTVKGKESFRREILKLCKTKSECTYYEAKY
jgi:hypothetical protein